MPQLKYPPKTSPSVCLLTPPPASTSTGKLSTTASAMKCSCSPRLGRRYQRFRHGSNTRNYPATNWRWGSPGHDTHRACHESRTIHIECVMNHERCSEFHNRWPCPVAIVYHLPFILCHVECPERGVCSFEADFTSPHQHLVTDSCRNKPFCAMLWTSSLRFPSLALLSTHHRP